MKPIAIYLILTTAISTILVGCTSNHHHRGLSPDGYHFIDNSPALPPPAHLITK